MAQQTLDIQVKSMPYEMYWFHSMLLIY